MKLIGKIFKSTLSFKDAPCLGSSVKQGKQCLNASKRLKNGNIWNLSGYCGLELLLLAFFAYELWQRLKSSDEGFDAFMKTGWNCG